MKCKEMERKDDEELQNEREMFSYPLTSLYLV